MDTATARARLTSAIEEMAKRHEVLDKHLRNEDREMPDDWSERATFTENDEVMEALDDQAVRQLEALKAAMKRVEAGTYGVCVKCGETLPDGRLEAVPHTATCTACAA